MFTRSHRSKLSVRLSLRLSAAFAALLIACVTGEAQVFNSGSNGSDGALNLTTPGTVVFDPATFNPPLDPDGDNVFHFTTINIGSGVTVKMKNVPLRTRSVVWLASGTVRIDGTIDLNGAAGQPVNDPVTANRIPSEPGPGGYSGGVGATPTSAAHKGNGPGGAGKSGFFGDQRGRGAGHATAANAVAYGNPLLLPLRGGSGGGGGGNVVFGGGGGAGGGALRLVSSLSIIINGNITSNGGNGGAGSVTGQNAQGGGGSGGGIHLIAPIISGQGAIQALGGGGDQVLVGSVGRIRLDAFQHTFTGASSPAASLGTPYNVPLPVEVPSVRVVSVAGVPVSSTPTGSFTIPDVTINQPAATPVVIEASNVPLGVMVQVHLISETEPDLVVNSTPLTGTRQQSTATASVKIPPGFSRGYVRVTWTP